MSEEKNNKPDYQLQDLAVRLLNDDSWEKDPNVRMNVIMGLMFLISRL